MNKFLLWTPRILAIAFILFISLFALASFEAGRPLREQIIGFLIYLKPTYVLIALLLVVWRFPLAGGLLFIAGGIFYLFMVRGFSWIAYLLISGPAFLTGALFILQKLFHKKNNSWLIIHSTAWRSVWQCRSFGSC